MSKRTAPVQEAPVTVLLDGHAEAVLRATPEALRELAAGHLLARGRIRRAADLLSLEEDEAEDVPAAAASPTVALASPPALMRTVRVRLAPGAPALDGAHPVDLLHALACAPCREGLRAGRGTPPGRATFTRLLEALYAHAERYADTGGVHAAGLVDGDRLLFAFEDVGRHNAVDKALGGALLAGAPLSRLGLVVSSRISGEIAWKAVRAGLTWVASRSLPTTLAVEVAGAAGLPLVARAGKDPTVFP